MSGLNASRCHLSFGLSPTGTQPTVLPVSSSVLTASKSSGACWPFFNSRRRNSLPSRTMQHVPSSLRVGAPSPANTHAQSRCGTFTTRLRSPCQSRSNIVGIFCTLYSLLRFEFRRCLAHITSNSPHSSHSHASRPFSRHLPNRMPRPRPQLGHGGIAPPVLRQRDTVSGGWTSVIPLPVPRDGCRPLRQPSSTDRACPFPTSPCRAAQLGCLPARSVPPR